MNQEILSWRNGIFMLFSIFLFGSCSNVPEKITHRSFVVEIKEMKFMPAELQAQVGDTVTWINKDLVAHDVTEETNNGWNSSPLAMGKSWSMVVQKSSDYYCSIHVVMKGKIVVQ
jgi:plastocyanin